ncbi:MAG TPA: heterodisulfide reductase-related iron-sulfur binding cluster [Dehalococcoidia bacterium]|nr:heterodisulfide reductase-related iron-sulfur binding cluster [Dehalococcoidia bacterium]
MTGKPGFAGPTVPSDADLSRCVHCGLCLQHCPTYTELGLETESPRGRLYLIRAMAEGRIEPTPATSGHLDLCLQCRNCEAVCPSGVAYGRIMEGARAAVLAGGRAPLAWRLRGVFLREVIARPGRLAVLAALLRLYRASGLRWLAERTPLLRDRVLLAPTIRGRPFRATGVLARPDGAVRHRVALLTGCLMPLAYGRVHEATVRVLARNGCEVVAPPEQACCGALHTHNGDRATAAALARRNVDAFLASGVEYVAVNSAGCGAALKEYPDLLAEDSAYAEKARRFSAVVRDIHELLVDLAFEPPRGRLEADVTYQDSCHLAHAQRIVDAPRAILRSIPGLRLVEMEQADRCCGSAGVYSLTQREMSLRLLDGKMRDIAATGARLIATANPGCTAQLEAGLRRHRMAGRVVHVMELLDEAYRDSGEGV